MPSAQSCSTLCDPMPCSPPGTSVHRDSPGQSTGVGCHIPPPGNLPNAGIEPRSPALQEDFFYCLSHRESPGNLLKPDSSESMMTLSHFCASYEKRHRLPLLSIIIQGQVYSKQPWNIQCFSQRKSQVHSQLC